MDILHRVTNYYYLLFGSYYSNCFWPNTVHVDLSCWSKLYQSFYTSGFASTYIGPTCPTTTKSFDWLYTEWIDPSALGSRHFYVASSVCLLNWQFSYALLHELILFRMNGIPTSHWPPKFTWKLERQSYNQWNSSRWLEMRLKCAISYSIYWDFDRQDAEIATVRHHKP